MVTEFRRLAFSRVELKQALESFSRETNTFILDGDIAEIDVSGGSLPEVRLLLSSPGGYEQIAVDITAAQLAAALLRFCMTHKIPIPKKSDKQIERAGDSVALSLSINNTTAVEPV